MLEARDYKKTWVSERQKLSFSSANQLFLMVSIFIPCPFTNNFRFHLQFEMANNLKGSREKRGSMELSYLQNSTALKGGNVINETQHT